MSIEELRAEVEEARGRLMELESKLREEERHTRDKLWFPQGFYTAYYVLSGMVLGMIASWCTLLFNVIGAAVLGEDPLKLLRVYSTILGGESATKTSEAVVLVFALGMHTLTGAICGAPIHVIYSRFFMGQPLVSRLLTGVWLGVIMWVVNFYGILAWLQPLLLGGTGSYIVQNVPWWVALLTHVAFTEVMLFLQPFAVFNARNYPGVVGAVGEARG